MRYMTRAALLTEWDGYLSITASEVVESDCEPQPSGLYDASGQALYRVPERVPMGFAAPRARKAGKSKGGKRK